MNSITKAPHIETDRLHLTWPSVNQIEQYYLSITGTNMFETIVWEEPNNSKEIHDFWKAGMQNDPKQFNLDFNLAFITKKNNEYIGGGSLRPVDGDPSIIDIGFGLAPKHHGKGYATESVGAMVDEAFRNRGAERIFANIFVGNEASRKLVEKLGFLYEGTQRHATLKRGKWLDQWLMAITRPDFEKKFLVS